VVNIVVIGTAALVRLVQRVITVTTYLGDHQHQNVGQLLDHDTCNVLLWVANNIVNQRVGMKLPDT